MRFTLECNQVDTSEALLEDIFSRRLEMALRALFGGNSKTDMAWVEVAGEKYYCTVHATGRELEAPFSKGKIAGALSEICDELVSQVKAHYPQAALSTSLWRREPEIEAELCENSLRVKARARLAVIPGVKAKISAQTDTPEQA